MTLGGLELSGIYIYICMVERDKHEQPWIRVRNKRPSGRSMGDICNVGNKSGNTHEGNKHKDKFEEIRITADSGAVDHVAPSDIARGVPIRETRASKQGVHYVAANGSVIINEGEKKISAYTDEGMPIDMTWQIAGVKKPLASVGRICDAGNVAIFTNTGEYIICKRDIDDVLRDIERKGQKTLKMKRENGVYNFNIRVPTEEIRNREEPVPMKGNRYAVLIEDDEEENFQRQGRSHQ